MATRLYDRLWERTERRKATFNPFPLHHRLQSPASPAPSGGVTQGRDGDPSLLPVPQKDPMQLGRSRLNPAERQRRLRQGLPSPDTYPEYKVGQQVWLSSQDIPLQVDSRKLAPWFIGPYTLDGVINPPVMRLKLQLSLNIHPTFHVSLLKPVSRSTLSPPAEPLPPTRLPAFTVRRILDVHRQGHGFQYLVD